METDSTRCFVALPLPKENKAELALLLRELTPMVQSRISWTKPENLHLTLRFLGDVPNGKLESVADALRKLPLTPFAMQPGGGGFFPNLRSPRVLWAGLEQGAIPCRHIADAVDNALHSLGFPKEQRAFTPHLTLARIREEGDTAWKTVLQKVRQAQWTAFEAKSLILYKSDLGPQGPKYTELARIGR